MTRRILMTAMALAALATACASSNDNSDSSASTAVEAGPVEGAGTKVADADQGEDSPCPAQGFEGEISRQADGGHVAASLESGAAGQIWTEGVVSTRLAEGQAYTVYVADHEYAADPREFDTVTAAPGGTVATLSFGLAGGFTAGQSFVLNTDEGVTMVVIVDSGGGASTGTGGARGTVTPIGWNDDVVCFDIDYSDDFQAVNGVVSARIVASF